MGGKVSLLMGLMFPHKLSGVLAVDGASAFYHVWCGELCRDGALLFSRACCVHTLAQLSTGCDAVGGLECSEITP